MSGNFAEFPEIASLACPSPCHKSNRRKKNNDTRIFSALMTLCFHKSTTTKLETVLVSSQEKRDSF
jgi:hypothetical protein